MQSDCKYIKINCPLHDLDPSICSVQNLYQHQMKIHLQQHTVGHTVELVKQINELKSVQLSMTFKLQSVASQSPKSPPLQPAATGNLGESIPSATPRETVTELLQNQSLEFKNEIRKLWADSMAYRDRMGQKLHDLAESEKRKDTLIASMSNKLNLMQKEMDSLKKDKVCGVS